MNRVAPEPGIPPTDEYAPPPGNIELMGVQQTGRCPPYLLPLTTIETLHMTEYQSTRDPKQKDYKLCDKEGACIYIGSKDLIDGSVHLSLKDSNGQDIIAVEGGEITPTCGFCICRGVAPVTIEIPPRSHAARLTENFSMFGSSFELTCTEGETQRMFQIAPGSDIMPHFAVRQGTQQVASMMPVTEDGLPGPRTGRPARLDVIFSGNLSPRIKACIIGAVFFLATKPFMRVRFGKSNRRRGARGRMAKRGRGRGKGRRKR